MYQKYFLITVTLFDLNKEEEQHVKKWHCWKLRMKEKEWKIS